MFDFRKFIEKSHSIFDSHSENIRYGFIMKMDFPHEMIVSRTPTRLTGYMHVRKKMHLNFSDTITFASITASLFCVETKMSWSISPCSCFKRLSKNIPDISKNSSIGSGIRTRGFTNWHLVNNNYLIELFISCYSF
jgi:hypothetical protein